MALSRRAKAGRAEIKRAFQQCDQGGKGFLNRRDLKMAILYLTGTKPTKKQVVRLLQRHGVSQPLSLDSGKHEPSARDK